MLAPKGEQGRAELFSESEGHGSGEEPFDHGGDFEEAISDINYS
jgi:hypothetical protein